MSRSFFQARVRIPATDECHIFRYGLVCTTDLNLTWDHLNLWTDPRFPFNKLTTVLSYHRRYASTEKMKRERWSWGGLKACVFREHCYKITMLHVSRSLARACVKERKDVSASLKTRLMPNPPQFLSHYILMGGPKYRQIRTVLSNTLPPASIVFSRWFSGEENAIILCCSTTPHKQNNLFPSTHNNARVIIQSELEIVWYMFYFLCIKCSGLHGRMVRAWEAAFNIFKNVYLGITRGFESGSWANQNCKFPKLFTWSWNILWVCCIFNLFSGDSMSPTAKKVSRVCSATVPRASARIACIVGGVKKRKALNLLVKPKLRHKGSGVGDFGEIFQNDAGATRTVDVPLKSFTPYAVAPRRMST